jgi:MOSC domain-containing protein YiiM
MAVKEVLHLLYFDNKNIIQAQRALRIPALSPGWRGSFEEIVAQEPAS